jgi:hypothetical protein
MTNSWLKRWDLTPDELDEILDGNPSFRGLTVGYVAEFKLRKMLLADPRVSRLHKYDDHDRKKKHDLALQFKGAEITVEVKSLQTKTVKEVGPHQWSGKFQCDASDKRTVTLPDGTLLQTTCLLYDGFDVIAANLFAFGEKWRWGFARNRHLPASRYKKYSAEQQKFLIATLVNITWPLQPPFEPEPFRFFDEIARERASQTR